MPNFLWSIFLSIFFQTTICQASDKVVNTPASRPSSTWDETVERSENLAEKAYQSTKDIVATTNKKLGNSRKNRSLHHHSLFLNYSLIDTWIPSKYGLAYSYHSSPSDTWEVDWNHSSLGFGAVIADLGKMSEDRFSVMRKSYSQRNSFYLAYGIHYYNFEAYLGDKFLANVSGTAMATIDLLKISSLGISIGLGNRWHFENWVIGFDWITLHIPLVILEAEAPYLQYASSSSDRQTVEDSLNILKHTPTLSAMKFQVGYSF